MSKIKIILTIILINLITPMINTYDLEKPLKKADLVIFSFNRPIQLYALLESVEKYITGIDETHVIYRSTNNSYEAAYQEVINRFKETKFHKQGQNPSADFKPLTLEATFLSPSDYVIFAVDDIIVKDYFDLSSDIELMERTGAYGFYYRLGKNITWCYMLNRADPVPQLMQISSDTYAWKICNGNFDWGYPNTVDMTLYKKSQIAKEFNEMVYQAPNPLEGRWACSISVSVAKSKIALCHEQSKIVNLPLNLVQASHSNRNSGLYSSIDLLDKFNAGLKIDISKLYKINNVSAHIDFVPTFIER